MKALYSKTVVFIFLVAITINANSQIAQGKSKFLGNIGGSTTGFLKYWNQITPENAGKWGSCEATKDVMTLTKLDAIYDYAISNSIPFKFHALVWGQQQPSWISSLSAADQKAQVEEWFNLIATRYPKMDMIDVVNEPLHAQPSYRDAIGGAGTTGWDWVIWSFEKARALYPNAKLILNDYDILNNSGNVIKYIEIINLLKSRNLIDGIGCQGHFCEGTPGSYFSQNLNTLAALNIPIYVSEFDLNILDETAKKNKYAELFPIMWEHPMVKGITLWGYKQGAMWRTDGFLVKTDGSETQAMVWLKNYVSTTTSLLQSENSFEIFPNPSHDVINISSTDVVKQIRVYSLVGELLLQKNSINSNSCFINISKLNKGIYLLEILQENNKTRTQIINVI